MHQEAQVEARVPSGPTSPPSSWSASVAHGPVVSRVFAIRHCGCTVHTGAVQALARGWIEDHGSWTISS